MQKEPKHWQYLTLVAAIALLFSVPVYAHFFGSLASLFALLGILACASIVRRQHNRSLVDYRNQAVQAERRFDDLSMSIFDRNRTSQFLQKSEKQHRDAFELAPTGIALILPSKQFLRVNNALAELLGHKSEDLVGTSLNTLIVPNDVESVEFSLSKLIEGSEQAINTEIRVSTPKGAIPCLRMKASLSLGPSNEPAYFVVQFEDITDRRRAEELALHNMLHDAMTDLPNRFLFLDRLKVAVNRLMRDPSTLLTVLHVDFDKFKSVNDRFGQKSADRMLVEAADRLRTMMRANNTVARLGADEFAILLENSSFNDVLTVVERIRKELSVPFTIDGEQIITTVSVGIAVGTKAHQSPEFLLRDAGTALMQAKSAGRDRYEIFTDDMHSRSIQSLQFQTELGHALDRGEIKLLYQPIVTLETGILAGFESLVRWEHPVRGLVSPVEFIPVAEETGLILQIGEWILRESCRQLRSWQEVSERSADLWVSVNVSSKQFADIDLVSLVADVLNETGLDPRYLKLEITESMMVENMEFVASVMQELKDRGVKLSIDDFGTGFSSLSMLDRLPLSSLKIDRSFVSQITDAENIVETVRTIVNLARSLNLEIIAEGVETIEQLSQLRQLGCQFGQGYCFATPLDSRTVDELIGGSPSTSPLFYLLPAPIEIEEPLEVG